MGAFGGYRGSMDIPVEKREEFTEQVMKILNYGGMMGFDAVNMFDHELRLLEPVQCDPGGQVCFYFNYFEDKPWETTEYDSNEGYFWSEKIGSYEYADVVMAVYMLYELYDIDFGVADYDGNIISDTIYAGWINHLLGTGFSMAKRFALWDNMQQTMFGQIDEDRCFGKEDCRVLIPDGLVYAAGGRDFTDLMYIKEGTSGLEEAKPEQGTYPADVLRCRKALEAFLGSGGDEKAAETVYELLKRNRAERERTENPHFKVVAECSLVLPARVLAYLTAELAGRNFWKDWKELYDKVYHDEAMKQYASEELEEWRRQKREEPIPQVRTSDFLYEKESPHLSYPDEVKDDPDYVVSDDDRLYWWDGSDEVIISDEMDKWLKELAGRHKKIMEENAGSWAGTVYPMKDFLLLFVDMDKAYERLYPFQTMFYEFMERCSQLEYKAALELLRQLADENWEKGKVIAQASGSWDIISRKITKNIGRVRMKRYLAVMANRKLRESYFGF